MAGGFEALYFQDFTTTSSITVTHNLDRVICAVRVIIGNTVRNDLVSKIVPSVSDPRNVIIVTLNSSNSGVIQIIDSDYIWSTLPTPEGASVLENNISGSAFSGSFSGSFFGDIVGGNISPSESGSHDLGSLAKPWKSLYVTNESIIFVSGGVSIAELTVDENGMMAITGSTAFGSLSSDTHVFTGSMDVSGALNVTGDIDSGGTLSGTFVGDGSGLTGISGSGGGTPGGADTYIQFNSGSAFSGSENLTFDYVNDLLAVTGTLSIDGNAAANRFDGLFVGDLTGDVTGNVLGNVTGDLTGDVAGDLTGSVLGTSSFSDEAAKVSNALSQGAGITAFSYDGSSTATVAIDSTVVTLTGVQTLSNKIVSGTFSGSFVGDGSELTDTRVIVQQTGSTVSGGPYSTLNFVGIAATDAGGGVAAITSTSIQESVVDAKGDLLAATADDTVTRLAVGSNNDILTADSGESAGIKWVTPVSSQYADYYDAGSTDIATSATTLGLDTSRQSNALFVLSSDQVTVQTGGAGNYLIRYDCSTNEDATTGATGIAVWLEINGVEVVATRSHTEHYTAGTDNTCGSSQIVTLADGDVLRLRGQIITGTGTIVTLAGGVSLTIMAPGSTGPTGPTGAGSNIIVQDSGGTVSGGPHSTLNFVGELSASNSGGGVAQVAVNLPEAQFANYYNPSQYMNITTTVSTLPFPTTRISSSAFTIDGSGEEVTINTAGTYRIDYGASSAESTGNDIVAEMWLEADTGSGFAEVGGTRAKWFHDSNGEEGGNAGFCIITLGATDVFRIRAQVVGGSDDLNTLSDGLRLGIQTVGANGAAGATGATGEQGVTGSGSTIIVEDEGSSIPNTPHSNLDFVGAGVTVTDAGSGVATITIPAGGGTANIAQYRQTGNLTIATSATTVVLNTNDFEDSDYTRSGENVTINTAGIYRINYSIFFDTTSNSRRTIEGWVENNTTEVVPSRAAAYARNNTDDTSNLSATFLVQLAASDVVRLRCQSTGTNGTAQGVGNRMWITLEFVRAP